MYVLVAVFVVFVCGMDFLSVLLSLPVSPRDSRKTKRAAYSVSKATVITLKPYCSASTSFTGPTLHCLLGVFTTQMTERYFQKRISPRSTQLYFASHQKELSILQYQWSMIDGNGQLLP